MSREQKTILVHGIEELLTCDICGKTGVEKHDYMTGIWQFMNLNNTYKDVCPECSQKIKDLGYLELIKQKALTETKDVK